MNADIFKEYIRRAMLSVPFLNHFARKRPGIKHGKQGVEQAGHREYVGGAWEEIGKLQFDFLTDEGLEPYHYLVDIACGSLRAGVHIITYLNKGNYIGLEKEKSLIEKGIEEELKEGIYEEKKPNFIISDNFEFEKIEKTINYAIAQSLFTHLPPEDIEICFRKLRKVIKNDGVFYATFFKTKIKKINPKERHDHASFYYTKSEMEEFGEKNGWISKYRGDWGHPRGQVLVEYHPKPK